MDGRPLVEELEHLYASLAQDERADLLEEPLVAAAHGGEVMVRRSRRGYLDADARGLLAILEEPA